MFIFSIEADMLDDSSIIDNEPYFPTNEKMQESYAALKKLETKIHKMKYGFSASDEGIIDRISVVMDSKEYDSAKSFCKGSALYPVLDFEKLIESIDEIMRKREQMAMNKEKDGKKSLVTETKKEEVHTEQVAHQESTDGMAKNSVTKSGAKDEHVKKQPPIANELESEFRMKCKLAELVQNPLYQSRKEKDGHHVIAESANSDLKIKVYGEGGKSDLTKGAYVYAKTHTKTGKARKISLADISKGGTGLMNFMLEFGNAFTMADISIANNRLWLLNELGKLNIIDLEPRLDMQGIHAFFMKKIAQGFEGLDTMTIYAEEVDGRIDIGIWQDTFDAYWEEIADDTDIDKRAWCKQAKALGWLLPDAGRGGGQHTPSAKRCKMYGRKETERIQRFSIPKTQAEQWMTQRNVQHMMSVEGVKSV